MLSVLDSQSSDEDLGSNKQNIQSYRINRERNSITHNNNNNNNTQNSHAANYNDNAEFQHRPFNLKLDWKSQKTYQRLYNVLKIKRNYGENE